MPKNKSKNPVEIIRNDIFFLIWVFFITIIFAIWYFQPRLIIEMIAVSAIFLIFFILEPLIKMSHGSKFAQIISKGEYVEPWKRFPIFFFALLVVFTIKHYLENYLYHSFEHDADIDLVLVIFWLIALFSIYYLIFTKQHEEEEQRRKKSTQKRKT